MRELDAAASTPTGVGGWLEQVSKTLDDLSEALDRHVDMVEGEDGLLAEIADISPHLQSVIDQMRADHKDLQGRVDSMKLAIKQARSGPDGPAEIRREIRELLSSLAQHRERGADLVYDAYNVDISAAD
ncbi:MAG: hemerythrin domain-containing protein [Actinobacteria bacterium]|nr:hemerythrin domain-containing protein [Actinomycetota bacterium]